MDRTNEISRSETAWNRNIWHCLVNTNLRTPFIYSGHNWSAQCPEQCHYTEVSRLQSYPGLREVSQQNSSYIVYPSLPTCSSAKDTDKERHVAIKKLSDPFQGVIHAKRCYREMKLLTHMKHENVRSLSLSLSILFYFFLNKVVSLYDVFTPSEDYSDFDTV